MCCRAKTRLPIHLPSPGNGASYLLPPRSACSARRASSAPRPDKTEHCFLQFLPRGIRDLQHPPALIPQQAGLCLAGGGRARCPGAARWLPALGRSEQLTKAPCCSHPLTAPGCLFKRRICSSCTFRGEKWSLTAGLPQQVMQLVNARACCFGRSETIGLCQYNRVEVNLLFFSQSHLSCRENSGHFLS